MSEQTAIEQIVEQLKAKGWKLQQSGIIYLNGSLGTNLLKDGEVLSLQLELYPDEEIVEQEWPESGEV